MFNIIKTAYSHKAIYYMVMVINKNLCFLLRDLVIMLSSPIVCQPVAACVLFAHLFLLRVMFQS